MRSNYRSRSSRRRIEQSGGSHASTRKSCRRQQNRLD
uniref:Uncharacterized protein n=1 Tax=Rhizophora mucronata TaxID=61149 RepID=A0A2P2N1D8_RHIMU